jgi:hypothetical protein
MVAILDASFQEETPVLVERAKRRKKTINICKLPMDLT